MSEMKMFLEEIHIKNCYSLSDVKVPLKPLTIFGWSKCKRKIKCTKHLVFALHDGK